MATDLTTAPAENSTEWIDAACRKFADATGWPMDFVPAGCAETESATDEAEDTIVGWRRAIGDGQQPIGDLRIEVSPDQSCLDSTFMAVTELAETIATMVNQLATTSRSLDSQSQQVSTLLDIGLSSANEKDVAATLQKLLRATIQLTGFRSACFFLLDPSTNRLNLRSQHHSDGLVLPESQRDLCESTPDLDALANGWTELRRAGSYQAERWLPDGTEFGYGVAVESESAPIGTLWVFDRRARKTDDREIQILHAIARQIAATLERVVLRIDSRARHRLQRELEAVSEGQTHDYQGRINSSACFEVASRCRSRDQIGGDLCELFTLDESRTSIAVGDACGHGIPASVVMTGARGALRAISTTTIEDLLEPAVVMDRLNRSLYNVTSPHQFMSFVFGILDTDAMTLAYTNAGHPAPLIIRNGKTTPLASHGMLLGVTEDATYDHSVHNLQADDMLVFFSDGIIEAMSRNREMFRYDGIISAIECNPDGSAQEVLDAIWREYESHSEGGGDPDDRTLLVIKLTADDSTE